MTEIATRDTAGHALTAKIEYARFLAKSGLLPASYRDKPENILFATEYGELLGLPAMAAITGIHVIEGKPSVSAGLISALVRRAGHRLRVHGDEHQAQAEITRADDPGFTYKSVWTMERAKQAGLLGKTNWQRYPAPMLKARCVSEVARDACQEVLLGIAYTPDELGGTDDGGEIVHDGWPTGPGGMINPSQMTEDEKDAAGLMTRRQRIEHEEMRRMGEPPPGAVNITSEADPDDPWLSPELTPKARKTARKAPKSTDLSAQPAGEEAALKLAQLITRYELGPDEDVAALTKWLQPAWTMTAGQVDMITGYLEGHLTEAGGDVDKARKAVWDEYKKANHL